MKEGVMRRASWVLLAVMAAAVAPPAAAEEGTVCVENASIDELQAALVARRTTAATLVRAYAARIEAYDRAGPRLNAVREMNPDALAIAAAIDAGTSAKRRPLEGIPVLLKDNIATGDRQHTTAGSLALAEAYAKSDATVTRLLREAGAVVIGKANLTEFANILALGMPSGYSSLGGTIGMPRAFSSGA
jgi:amidase